MVGQLNTVGTLSKWSNDYFSNHWLSKQTQLKLHEWTICDHQASQEWTRTSSPSAIRFRRLWGSSSICILEDIISHCKGLGTSADSDAVGFVSPSHRDTSQVLGNRIFSNRTGGSSTNMIFRCGVSCFMDTQFRLVEIIICTRSMSLSLRREIDMGLKQTFKNWAW